MAITESDYTLQTNVLGQPSAPKKHNKLDLFRHPEACFVRFARIYVPCKREIPSLPGPQGGDPHEHGRARASTGQRVHRTTVVECEIRRNLSERLRRRHHGPTRIDWLFRNVQHRTPAPISGKEKHPPRCIILGIEKRPYKRAGKERDMDG